MSSHRATGVHLDHPEELRLLSIDYPSEPPSPPDFLRPGTLFLRGRPEPIAQPWLALFCSERCPGDLIVKACDVATALRDAAVPVISGFHSPVERECLRILLRGTQPIMVSPARSIERLRLSSEWRGPIREGRLLLVSPFGAKQVRITAVLAMRRNEFVAALARAVLVVYADPGGLIDALTRKVLAWRKPLLAVESPHSANLVRAGAEAVNVHEIASCWSKLIAR